MNSQDKNKNTNQSEESHPEGSYSAALQGSDKARKELAKAKPAGVSGGSGLPVSHDVPVGEVEAGAGRGVKKTWARGRLKKTLAGTGRGRDFGAQPDDPATRNGDTGVPSGESRSAEGGGREGSTELPASQDSGTPRKKSGAQKRRERKLRSGEPGVSPRVGPEPGPQSTSGANRKRGRSTGSTPPELRQTQKRANSQADGLAKSGTVVVAIVSRGFPETLLEETQVRELDEAVMLHVMKQNADYVPQFEARRLVDGALHVTCRSELDSLWLQQNVEQLKPWDGADLAVKTLDQLPKRTKVMIYTKTGGNASEILKALGTFNKGLRAESWRILDFKKCDKQKDNSLLVSVTDKDVRELQRLEWRPRLGLGRVKCSALGGGGAPSGSKGGTVADQQQEQGSETSNMEVDNPVPENQSPKEVSDDRSP